MLESLLKAEAKYFKDENGESSRDRLSSRDGESSRDQESSRDRDKYSDSDSSDEFVYSKMPKTISSSLRCKKCNEELTQRNFGRHNQSLKHKQNARRYNRNKNIESANESGKRVTNKDIEQKLDKQYSELEGIKYCDSCNMYLDNNTAYNKHVETLKHKNNAKLNKVEIIKNGNKVDCVICKTTLSQYSVDQHFKIKRHLDIHEGNDKDNIISEDNNITEDSTISKDLRSSFTDNATNSGYRDICNTRYDNKKKHNDSDKHKENEKQRKLTDGKWRDKVIELRVDHNMKHNQIILTSSDYEDPKFL